MKKRLFSSPAAFASTLEAHLASEVGQARRGGDRDGQIPEWLDEALEWDAEPSDDDAGSDGERELFGRVAELTPVTALGAEYRGQLSQWAERHAGPAGSKARALIAELEEICRPGGDWGAGEWVIVFTEYRTTAPVLRNACDQLLTRFDEGGPGYLAGLLAGAVRAVERARRHQSVAVVWTGPESGIATSRLTAATVIDLIGEARQESCS